MNRKEKIWLKALDCIKHAFEENNCVYFLDTGTLLGAIRDKQFIPWDNDIDLGVVDCKDKHTCIINICEYMYKHGYNVTATIHEIDVFDNTGLLDLGVKFYDHKSQEYVASFGKVCGSSIMHMLYMSLSRTIIFKKGYGSYKVKSIISYVLRKAAPLFPKQLIKKISVKANVSEQNLSIPDHLLINFVDYKFYGSLYKIPSSYIQYLEHRYGDNWSTPNPKYNYITDDQSIIK